MNKLQQIAFNHSSNIDFKDSMNAYKKYTAKPSSCLVIVAYYAIREPFAFQRESFRNNIKTNHDNLR